MSNFLPQELITLIVLGLLLGFIPFVIVMVTSFAKIVIVFTIIRTALGLQSTPPNMVLNGLALVLSIYIMYPVINESFESTHGRDIATIKTEEIPGYFDGIFSPFRKFLYRNTTDMERNFFLGMANYIWPKEIASSTKPENFAVLIPAFLLRELTEAFQIGFLLYLPFVVIDLVISNILLAMGMMMVSPTTISLPFKLLLFVFVDGWSEMIKGLILTYQ